MPPAIPSPFASLAAILSQHAASHGDTAAIVLDGQATTYGELEAQARALAGHLLAQGVARGDRVLYIGRNCADQIALFFACARGGFRLVLPNWRLSAREMAVIVADASPAAMFVQPEFAHLASETAGARLHVLDKFPSSLAAQVASQETARASSDDPATDPEQDLVICYTSGSTGAPKGVRQTHGNWLAALAQMTLWPGGKWREGSTALVLLPFFHVAGLRGAIVPLAFGGTAFLLTDTSAEAVVDTLRRHAFGKLSAVPTVLKTMLDSPSAAAMHGRLETVLYGGATIPPALIERARAAYGCEFVQTYGASETTGTAFALDDADHQPEALKQGRCGRALAGMEAVICRPDGSTAAPGETGEIKLRGPTVSPGYWKRPDETAARFEAGWFRPGDMGSIDDAGFLCFSGRTGDLIRSGGEKVYPREVEQVLMEHPEVLDTVVYGIADETWGEIVSAAVVLKPRASVDVASLVDFCRGRIAAFKCPKRMALLPAIPRNAGGKVDRKALLQAVT